MRQIQQEQADAQAKVAADKAEMETSVKQAAVRAAATSGSGVQNTRAVWLRSASELQSLRDEKTSLQTQLADLQKKLDEQRWPRKPSLTRRTRLTEQRPT